MRKPNGPPSRWTGAAVAVASAAIALVAPPAVVDALTGGGKWLPTGSMSVPRARHTATVLGGPSCDQGGAPAWCGDVLVAGGEDDGTPLASAEVYDPATGLWSPTQPMGAARSGHTATLLDGPACDGEATPAWCGKVLVAGGPIFKVDHFPEAPEAPPGEDPPDLPPEVEQQPTASAELYDPVSGTWQPVAGMNSARAGHTATLLPDATVLVVGGTPVIPGVAPDPSAEIYDPQAGSWAQTPGPATVRVEGHTATALTGPACTQSSPPEWCGDIVVAGGREPVNTEFSRIAETDAVEAFDAATRAWRPLRSLAVTRADHTATMLPDGRVQFAGGVLLPTPGSNFGPHERRTVELYDPAADTSQDAGDGWTLAEPLESPRGRHTATLLPDGRVLAAGGTTGTLGLVERYGPGTDAWEYSAPLAVPRSFHTAVLLEGQGCAPSCGLVLAAGGFLLRNKTEIEFSSAELYDPSADTAPARVTDAMAFRSSRTGAQLSFRAVGTIEGGPPVARRYVIKQSTRPITSEKRFRKASPLCGGVCEFDNVGLGGVLQVFVTGLLPDHTYYFAIKALDSAGDRGALSNTASVVMPVVPPGPVRGLKGKPLSQKEVRLSFEAAGSDGDGGPPARLYVIKQSRRRIATAGAFRRARLLCVCRFSPADLGDRLTVDISGLRRDTVYHYAVRARDNARNLGPVSKDVRIHTDP